jgi:hypothetical protein
VSIPCFLTNRDLMAVVGMVEHLQRCDDVGPVTVIDCDSTYQPLLDWYASQRDVTVIRTENRGPQALWQLMQPSGDYFASDADLDISGVPTDFLVKLRAKLLEPHWKKVGLSLRLDDIPDAHPFAAEVKAHEAQFWQRTNGPDWLIGLIDTTAAMYRGRSGWNGYGPAVRSAWPYCARHLLWYLTPGNVPEDWQHYLNRLSPKGVHWSPKLRDALGL